MDKVSVVLSVIAITLACFVAVFFYDNFYFGEVSVVGVLESVTVSANDSRCQLVVDGVVYSTLLPRTVDVLDSGVFRERFMSEEELGGLVGQRVLLECTVRGRGIVFSPVFLIVHSVVPVGGVN